MNSLEILKDLEKQKKLTPLERILAVTNGSVTQIVETHIGEEVKIRTIKQEVKRAGEFADWLDVGEDDAVNFREVEIADQSGKVWVKAKSWIPVKRLKQEFKDDLMKADVPIGKLLIKHGIEARRELLDVWVENNRVKRLYNIINNGETLMRIEEEFF
jgi:beta-ribofuranosylaminobenzene 5'-phosphate synthase